MYRKPNDQMSIEDFILPFDGKLDKNNRWVQLATLIPWDKIEEKYASLFPENVGNVAKPARLALSALIIKEKLGCSDRETVEQIKENPYLQYFAVFRKYRNESPFDFSLMVHFRKRFNLETMQDINEMICLAEQENKDLSGPKLGRPPLVKDKTELKIERQDAKIRNAVEGKLGEGKRRYGLGLIMARLAETSETVIALQFLVMNLDAGSGFFFSFLSEPCLAG